MSFFKQLLADAQPKADVLKQATKNVAVNIARTVPVRAAKNIGYKGLVNATAVSMAVVQPLAPLSTKFWSYMEELAKPPVVKVVVVKE